MSSDGEQIARFLRRVRRQERLLNALVLQYDSGSGDLRPWFWCVSCNSLYIVTYIPPAFQGLLPRPGSASLHLTSQTIVSLTSSAAHPVSALTGRWQQIIRSRQFIWPFMVNILVNMSPVVA